VGIVVIKIVAMRTAYSKGRQGKPCPVGCF
jgi:hypothetical protein